MLIQLRKYFVAGLLVWVPLIVTFLVIRFLVEVLDFTILLLPRDWRPENLLGFSVPGTGVVVAFVIVLVTGLLAANFIGKRFVSAGESLVGRIPLVRSIYGAVKQLVETVFSDSGQSFRKVLLLEYPKTGSWTVGFQTGSTMRQVQNRVGRDMLTVFVPTAPNPTSGFVIMVARDDVFELDIPVEDGLKFVMSLGVVTPPSEATGPCLVRPPVSPPPPDLPVTPGAPDSYAPPSDDSVPSEPGANAGPDTRPENRDSAESSRESSGR